MALEHLKPLTEMIIGCAFRVSNTLGAGFLEKVYENALAHELRKSGLDVRQQCSVNVMYDGVVVGEFVADLIVEDVLIELKAVRSLDDFHLAQCLNYRKATRLPLCLLLNFGQLASGSETRRPDRSAGLRIFETDSLRVVIVDTVDDAAVFLAARSTPSRPASSSFPSQATTRCRGPASVRYDSTSAQQACRFPSLFRKHCRINMAADATAESGSRQIKGRHCNADPDSDRRNPPTPHRKKISRISLFSPNWGTWLPAVFSQVFRMKLSELLQQFP